MLRGSSVHALYHVMSAEWSQVAEAEKEGAVLKALAQGWQREVAIVEPQLYQLQAQVAASQKQVQPLFQQHKIPWLFLLCNDQTCDEQPSSKCITIRILHETFLHACSYAWYGLQGNQEEHLLHMQQKLAELHQMQHDHQQQVRTVTAEAAAQQASANQLIKHLQDQLSTIQTANTESIQAVAKTPTEGTNWTIEQATASVARVLHVMATSRTE